MISTQIIVHYLQNREELLFSLICLTMLSQLTQRRMRNNS